MADKAIITALSDELFKSVNEKSVTILGHNNIDIDAALSGILFSRLLDFWDIPNQFCILESVKEDETYDVIKELIGIDLKGFEVDSESEERSLFLVDHYSTSHKGNVLGYIDHHPTSQKQNVSFAYTRNSSATAYLIYELMREVNYPIDKQDALMIITAMMADTVCFKSTKARMDECEVAKELAKEYDLDWDKIQDYCLCLTPIDKMSINDIIQNGLKVYRYKPLTVRAAYIQVYGMPDKKLIDKWLLAIKDVFYIHLINGWGLYVFLIFDLKKNLTYEYQVSHYYLKEIVHSGIISRGQDVIPRLERRLLIKIADERRLSEMVQKIVQKLSVEKETIATMESCTGGQLASEITNISGASDVLKESYITYSNEAKIKLGVPKEIIEKYSVYSAETAVEMANAVCRLANSDIGVGITGQLGRIDPNNPGVKDNEVWYAIKFKNQDDCVVRKLTIFRDVFVLSRAEKKKIVVEAIINTMYDLLV